MEIKEAIKKVASSGDLTEDETRSVFDQIMSGQVAPKDMADFLMGLRKKGETPEEITGAARVMREKAVKINIAGSVLLDTCGTGGTGKDTFNISTTVAFVAAGCGVKVAKHGNRAASGRCGSADVLEALGVKIDVSPLVTKKCIDQVGVGFLFAPLYHKAMKHAIGVRKKLGVRTIFNLVGPLSNPASATCQVMGVCDDALTGKMADVLGKLGLKRAYVVHGEGNFDEVTISGKTKVSELAGGAVKTYHVTPEDFGIKKSVKPDLAGGSADENAAIVRSIISGKEKGAKLDIVLVNASLALMAAEKAKDYKEGVRLARESINSGRALEKLDQLIKMTVNRTP